MCVYQRWFSIACGPLNSHHNQIQSVTINQGLIEEYFNRGRWLLGHVALFVQTTSYNSLIEAGLYIIKLVFEPPPPATASWFELDVTGGNWVLLPMRMIVQEIWIKHSINCEASNLCFFRAIIRVFLKGRIQYYPGYLASSRAYHQRPRRV